SRHRPRRCKRKAGTPWHEGGPARARGIDPRPGKLYSDWFGGRVQSRFSTERRTKPMFPEGPLFRGESLKLPLGRTLLVIVYFLFLNRIGLTEGDDAFVGFVFGLAGALAAWVVFSPSAGWKRRLCVAL